MQSKIASCFHKLFSDVAISDRVKAIEQSLHGKGEPRVDAAIDDRHILKRANHYARWGSEKIHGFAVNLERLTGVEYRSRLHAIEVPTVIILDAPCEELEHTDQEQLQEQLNYLSNGQYEHFEQPGNIVDFTASFQRGVPPQWIVEHSFLDSSKFSQ